MTAQDADLGTRVRSFIDRGLIKYSRGWRDEAIDLWRQALELAPENDRALDYLETVGAIPPRQGAEQQAPDPAPSAASVPPEGSTIQPPLSVEVPVVAPLEGEAVSDVDMLMQRCAELESEGNLKLALSNCEEVLKRQPGHEAAFERAARLKTRLVRQHLEDLKPLERVPRIAANDSSIFELSLDPIGGFMLSQIDGQISLDELLTILGTFDKYRVVSTLFDLVQNGVVTFDPL